MQHLFRKMHFAFLITLSVLFFSCQKELEFDDTLPKVIVADTGSIDFTTKVRSTVSGFVTNEIDSAVAGATVTAGGVTVSTDKYGYFSFHNINVVKTAAVVRVDYPGYFPGIKTYVGVQNKGAFFRIKLIKKVNQGTVSANSGGDVVLANGLKISFPAAAFVVAANNAPYSGTVNIAANWLNPTANDLNSIMPGDLRGIDANGKIRALQTFGMAAVELTGASGELLQLAAGKKATLTIPVPSSMQGTAPATIPLWHFDEAIGLWQEEGVATKNGSDYVGEVSHFSFWNCDFPLVQIYFSCTLLNQNGTPMAYTPVLISDVNNPWRARWGYTDSTGYVGGIVPGNSTLKMEVYSSYYCSSSVYSSVFSTTTSDVALGNVVIPNTLQGVANITGTVVDCNNLPIANAQIILYKDYQYYVYNTDASGMYNFNATLCGNTGSVSIVAIDRSSVTIASIANQNVVTGSNTIPAIQLCNSGSGGGGGGGTTTSQFINYSIDTTTISLTSPVDTFNCFADQQVWVSGYQIPNWTNSISFSFDSTNLSVGATRNLNSFYSSTVSDSFYIRTPILVNITEYGGAGQYIAGNFSGTINGIQRTYNVTCSFRLRKLWQ